MKKEHVVFDLGETVLTDDWNPTYTDFLSQISSQYGISPNSMKDAWLSLWARYSTDRNMGEEEFWNQFLDLSGAKTRKIEPGKRLWRDSQRPKEGMLELLGRLKRSGNNLGVLSNIPKPWFDYKRSRFGLDKYFDTYVTSGEVGILKPDPRIYTHLCEAMNTTPEDITYVDNSQQCLAPAEDLGMRTVLFEGQEKLEKDLASLGVSF